MTSGIYTITNLVNNKVYVGYSVNIKNRCSVHLSNLNAHTHGNEYLQKDYILFGKHYFKFEELIECSIHLLASEEHYWATILNVHNKEYGYNIAPTHPNWIYKHSQETKDKIGSKLKNRFLTNKQLFVLKTNRINIPHTTETKLKIKTEGIKSWYDERRLKLSKRNSKIVYQYDISNNFIKKWNSVKEAFEILNICANSIAKCARGGYKLAGNFKFTYNYDI